MREKSVKSFAKLYSWRFPPVRKNLEPPVCRRKQYKLYSIFTAGGVRFSSIYKKNIIKDITFVYLWLFTHLDVTFNKTIFGYILYQNYAVDSSRLVTREYSHISYGYYLSRPLLFTVQNIQLFGIEYDK